jgi:hypothetical protein
MKRDAGNLHPFFYVLIDSFVVVPRHRIPEAFWKNCWLVKDIRRKRSYVF